MLIYLIASLLSVAVNAEIDKDTRPVPVMADPDNLDLSNFPASAMEEAEGIGTKKGLTTTTSKYPPFGPEVGTEHGLGADAVPPEMDVASSLDPESLEQLVKAWQDSLEDPAGVQAEEWDVLPVGSVASPRQPRSVVAEPLMYDFRAYDCSTPTDVTSVAMGPDLSCDIPDAIDRAVEARYHLLQKAERTRFPMQRCQVYRSRVYYVCNEPTGHSTINSREWQFKRHWPLSTEDCQDIWKTKTFKGQGVQLNSTSYIIHFQDGYVYSSGSDIHCKGSWGGFELGSLSGHWGDPGAVTTEHFEITLD